MDSDSRSCLLKHCARQCADTGVLQSYRKLYQTVSVQGKVLFMWEKVYGMKVNFM